MELKHIVIHKLNKEEKATGNAWVDLSEKPLPITSKAISFISELNGKYSQHKHTYGKFIIDEDESDENLFPVFLNAQRDSDSFLNFSRISTTRLKDIITSIAPAKGGYIVFAEYEFYGKFLSVFLIRDTNGSVLVKNSSEKIYEINDTTHVDIERLAMACRVNIEYFSNSADTYLTFINKRTIDSKFFLTWMSANDTSDSKRDTQNLYSTLKTIAVPTDADGNQLDQTEFLNRVHNFIKLKKQGNSLVDVKELSAAFFDDEDFIKNHASEQGIPLNEEFKPDPKELKRFVKVNVKADKIKMEFPNEYLIDQKIRLIEGTTQILIDSEDLYNELMKEYAAST